MRRLYVMHKALSGKNWQNVEISRPLEDRLKQMGKDLRFIVERRDFESWARGAGSLVLRHFLASPARVHTERMLVES